MSDIVFDGMVFDRLREIGDQSDRIASLESEIARLRLTDAEREAIQGMASDYQEIAEFNEERCHPHYAEKASKRAAMLRNLLERLGGTSG